MVEASRRWTPAEIWQGLRRTFDSPWDVPLCLRIGWFVWRLPASMERRPLPEVLAGIRQPMGDAGEAIDGQVGRIGRLRQAWLNLPSLAARNTCYVRAITLYRFLRPDRGTLRIHFGVEPGVSPDDRVRGHAWVTHEGDLLEPPEPVVAGRVREIYVFPEAD